MGFLKFPKLNKNIESAITAPLQYEIDTSLSELINLIGLSKAERSYRLCNEAILTLEKMANKIGL